MRYLKMLKVYRTDKFEEFKAEVLNNLEPLLANDAQYVADLEFALPYIFKRAIKESYAYPPNQGLANISRTLYQMGWEYEDSGTLRRQYPSAFVEND